jgi:ubiquinone/menaquinone biosynthesis C-methylase UbiE/pimeloyl-ACP methyl ester carboxylesterase
MDGDGYSDLRHSSRSTRLSRADHRVSQFHRATIGDSREIASILSRLKREKISLANGMDHRNRRRWARVSEVRPSKVVLEHQHIDPSRQREIYLTFSLDGAEYFLAVRPVAESKDGSLEMPLPEAIYKVERRGEAESGGRRPGDLAKVEVRSDEGGRWAGYVLDSSAGGLGLRVPDVAETPHDGRIEVRFEVGSRHGDVEFGVVRHCAQSGAGWKRLGISLGGPGAEELIPVEQRSSILERGLRDRTRDRAIFAREALRIGPRRLMAKIRPSRVRSPVPTVVSYANDRGHAIRGILDHTGDPKAAPAVIIPPAWGRTKETLLPLAQSLLRTFSLAGQSLVVLRFDGTQRKGESYVDPSCRRPGDETLHFTYSQAARDISASVRFLQGSEFETKKVVLVTFSLAAIDGRRAVATDPSGAIVGWISVVGMADVQSAMRSVSGGVDFYKGALHGVSFGVHELGGVRIDIDHAAKDVLENNLGGLDQAISDMEKISVPVTWIHGRHDGWMDINAVRRLVSAGMNAERRLIEVPTGHQLRTSREALETFQLVSEEASRMLLGVPLRGAMPDLVEMEARQRAERARVPRRQVNLLRFWHDYILGRDETLGMQLLTATEEYTDFMDRQIRALQVAKGSRVLDLGSGTGELALRLAAVQQTPPGVHVVAVDFVREALKRGMSRSQGNNFQHSAIMANLECSSRWGFPLASESVDAALASLLISYLDDKSVVVAEIHRVLRRGGRVVISSPRRDADLSGLYRTVREQLPPEVVKERFGEEIHHDFEEIQRRHLNEAAKLVSLEEEGRFSFFDAEELVELVRNAGFTDVRSEPALGSPPQVILVSAAKH